MTCLSFEDMLVQTMYLVGEARTFAGVLTFTVVSIDLKQAMVSRRRTVSFFGFVDTAVFLTGVFHPSAIWPTVLFSFVFFCEP